MYTVDDYFFGCTIYLIGVALLLLAVWLPMRKLNWAPVRHLVLLTLAVLLLTPVSAYPDTPEFLAPAFFVAFYEGFVGVEGAEGFSRGLAPIMAVYVGAIVVYTVLFILVTMIRRRSNGNN